MSDKENYPIDFVIPWVDGADPQWLAEKNRWESVSGKSTTEADRQWNQGDIRYRDWDTLRYFFRGVERFAPWVHKVYFITWGHLPPWLNTAHPGLEIVRHEQYIPAEFLPTFNSHTIELNLHRIRGLSDHFVYYNDDTFLTAPVRQEDFFCNGLPCDSAVLNPIPMDRKVQHAEINNIAVINDHFEKNEVIRRNLFKWFNLKYGTKLFRTCLMLPWKHFVGLYEPHLPNSYLKSTFETVWAAEADELRAACACKFRDRSNVNQCLFRNWQIAQGNFSPRSLRIGQSFMYGEGGNYDEVCAAVAEGRRKMICINDSEAVDDFALRKTRLITAFEKLLPEKSEFEIA